MLSDCIVPGVGTVRERVSLRQTTPESFKSVDVTIRLKRCRTPVSSDCAQWRASEPYLVVYYSTKLHCGRKVLLLVLYLQFVLFFADRRSCCCCCRVVGVADVFPVVSAESRQHYIKSKVFRTVLPKLKAANGVDSGASHHRGGVPPQQGHCCLSSSGK